MANSKVTYTAGSTGAGQTFAVTFSFINRSHVDVKVNGTSAAFTWNSDSEVAVTGTVTTGNTVLVIRVSSLTTRLVDYVDGSNLSETDLDTDSLQAFYLSQEAVDAFGAFDTGIVATDTHILVANGTKFNNVIVSGDATLANTGALTISTGAVETAMIAADAVDSTKLADDAVDSEHYTDGSIDLVHMSVNSIDSDQYVDGSIDVAHMSVNSIDSDQYVDGSIDLVHMSVNSIDSDQYVDGSIDVAHMSTNSVDSDQYVDGSIDAIHMSINSVDSDQYVDGSIDTIHISDTAITTAKVTDANITLAKIVSASATNKILGRVASGAGVFEEVTLQTTLSSTNEAIPTSKAVRDDIVAIVNAVGGFVAIATEITFPNDHPDPDGGAGTVVSIANAGGVVVDGSGQSTTGRTVGGTTVTITGIPATYQSATIADGLGMQVISTITLNTYTYHKIAAKEGDTNIVATNIANVNAVAGNDADITTVAGQISPTNNIQTIATNNTNVTNVGGNIANVNTVAGNGTNINIVAGDITNVNTTATNIAQVNNFAEVYRIAAADPTTALTEGDLVFRTDTDTMRVYNGSAWQNISPTSTASAFGTVSVAGQSDVVADTTSDALTFVGSGATSITTNAGTDTVTISSTAGASNGFAIAMAVAL